MDPFARFPWFVLQDILCRLPDLPSLQRLAQASPAVAHFCQHDAIFSAVIERIMAHTDKDKGMNPKVQFYFRTLALLWWRGEGEDSQNPLPSSFEEVVYFIGTTSPEGIVLENNSFGDMSLPRSVPPAVLNRVLCLSTRLRQIAHACFHDWISRCLSLRPERLQNPDDEFSSERYHPRPQGVRFTPIDIGPPSWLEEQRLIRAILPCFLFWELKRAVMAGMLSIQPSNFDLRLLERDDVEQFWCGRASTALPRLRTSHGTQFHAVLSWLQQHQILRSSELWSPKLSARYLCCCPELTPLSPKQWDLPDDPYMSFVPGYTWLWKKMTYGRSPMRTLDYNTFQQLGFDFWDEERMVSLGFMASLRSNYVILDRSEAQDLWFRWSSILTEDHWARSIKPEHG
ncbi:uncharacterized protein N7459_004102 [Penicillium hispanicum]|uniref:uncharacterized protein n=1 Tax=Penicillium hispanicum TaxID=1080232 RepID=UPI002541D478|nr:uncharacterized protein N7459_004102 [Penicillium hispanicum]KAJ5584302.1 hypothetical protein N7459_004102 [Penicillium hispanicum]